MVHIAVLPDHTVLEPGGQPALDGGRTAPREVVGGTRRPTVGPGGGHLVGDVVGGVDGPTTATAQLVDGPVISIMSVLVLL